MNVALSPMKERKHCHQELFARDREIQTRTARWLQAKFQVVLEKICDESAGIVDLEASRWDLVGIVCGITEVSKILSPEAASSSSYSCG